MGLDQDKEKPLRSNDSTVWYKLLQTALEEAVGRESGTGTDEAFFVHHKEAKAPREELHCSLRKPKGSELGGEGWPG